MTPNGEREKDRQSQLKLTRFSRRTALKYFVAVTGAAAAVSLPDLAAAQTPPTTNDPEAPYFDWKATHKLAEEVQSNERRPYTKQTMGTVRRSLNRLESAANSTVKRLDSINEVIEIQHEQNLKTGKPSLIGESEKVLGAMERVGVNDVIPSYKDRADLTAGLEQMRSDLESAREKQQSDIRFVPVQDFDDLAQFAQNGADLLNVVYEKKAKKACEGEMPIGLDPYIKPTPEGEALLKERKAQIQGVLTGTPFINACSEMIITGSDYSGNLGSAEVGNAHGVMISMKPWGSKLMISQYIISTDTGFGLGKHTVPIVVGHEVKGHGGDVFSNKALANTYSPQELVERSTLRQRVINDPDWGSHDQSVEELFKPFKAPSDLEGFLSSGEVVDQESFMNMITGYPRWRLAIPPMALRIDLSGKGESGMVVSTFFDQAVNSTSNDPVYGEIVRPLDEEKIFPNLKAFARDYRSQVREQAEGGNVRARFGDDALTRLVGPLSNTEFMPQNQIGEKRMIPRADTPERAEVFANYIAGVGLHCAMYDSFVAGSRGEDLRSYLTNEQKTEAQKAILYTRMLYRAELLAQGVAFGLFLKDRMIQKPSYLELAL